MKEIIISSLESGQTVFKYVKKYLNNASLGFIEKLFRKKDVKVNGHWVNKNVVLNADDVLRIYVNDSQLNDFNQKKAIVPIDFNNQIIYEDSNILIINKPKGVLIHEDKNEKVRTLSNEVISYLINKGEYSSLMVNAFTPAPCHRLDRNTSGLVVFAKNLESLKIMDDLFKEKKELDKYYKCLVFNVLSNGGVINKPLLKDSCSGLVKINEKGKTAITEYKIIKNYSNMSLIEIHLITGRTHQIRVHMASIGHPVVGDAKYGDFKLNHDFDSKYKYNSQFLHAYKLIFHNIKGKLSYLSNKEFCVDFSDKELAILNCLK